MALGQENIPMQVVLNFLNECLDHRNQLDVVFIDFIKNVDTVKHSRLLKKLKLLA